MTSPVVSRAALPDVRLWVGEKKLPSGSGGVCDHVNPTTGRVQAQVPLAGAAEVAQAVEASAEAFGYYFTATVGWTTTNLHYQPEGGSWTAVPGVGMEAACTGWVKRSVDLGTATKMQAAFNNGNGV